MSGESGASVASGHDESRTDRDRPKNFRFSGVWAALRFLVAFLVALGTMLMAAAGSAQSVRVVQGTVTALNEQPLKNAIVYLQDVKSMEIKTYITEADGKFRFSELSPDVDYEVWARYQGHRSKSKSISSFDSKGLFSFDLKIKN
jgi:hypothetical protein